MGSPPPLSSKLMGEHEVKEKEKTGTMGQAGGGCWIEGED